MRGAPRVGNGESDDEQASRGKDRARGAGGAGRRRLWHDQREHAAADAAAAVAAEQLPDRRVVRDAVCAEQSDRLVQPVGLGGTAAAAAVRAARVVIRRVHPLDRARLYERPVARRAGARALATAAVGGRDRRGAGARHHLGLDGRRSVRSLAGLDRRAVGSFR